MAQEYLSIPEAAGILGISRIAVFKQVKKGKLPAIRIGRNWAVPASALSSRSGTRSGDLAAGKPPGARSPGRVPPAPGVPAAEPQKYGGDRGFEDMGWD